MLVKAVHRHHDCRNVDCFPPFGNLHGTMKASSQRGSFFYSSHFQLRGPLGPVSEMHGLFRIVQTYLPPLEQPRAITMVYNVFRSLRPPQLTPQRG